MLKIAHKDDYNAVLKRCEEASSSAIRIMTSHFVALLSEPYMKLALQV